MIFKVSRLLSRSLYKDGIIFAADTRATGGNIIGDKNCEKIHYLAPNVYTCGAGTAADCDHVTGKWPLTNYFQR
jgi:20S proteasome subunit beta 2